MKNQNDYNLSTHNVTDPFDYYTDPCHLAWLCRDNRNLLNYLIGADCNGSGESFEALSPDYFANCP